MHDKYPKRGLVATQKPSIISVCAVHLEGKDLVVEQLFLMPYFKGAVCEDKPSHDQGMRKWFFEDRSQYRGHSREQVPRGRRAHAGESRRPVRLPMIVPAHTAWIHTVAGTT
jgi:hypothetical protein